VRLSLGAIALAAIALAVSACGRSHSTRNGPPPAGPTVSSSRLILDGAVRCTATVKTPVEVGHELQMSVTLHNLSQRKVQVPLGYGGEWVVVQSPDGTTYDTRIPLENELGPARPPVPLEPGATATEPLQYLRVRWEGPLRVTPGCGLVGAPPVRVAVHSPGLPPSPSAAVKDVVAGTGHLLDHCRPHTSGVPVVGRIDPPGGYWPPLQARCSITLRRERDFYHAQVLIVSPPNLPGAGVRGPYETLSPYWHTGDRRNAEVIGWELVVTRKGALSVYSAEIDEAQPALEGRAGAPSWRWSSSGPRRSGSGVCGSAGGGFGGMDGPEVSFISRCGH
jgi:hypothetical protein